MKAVNGWAMFSLEEAMQYMCGAEHIWFLYEEGMPCMCGNNTLVRLGNGGLWRWGSAIEKPNAAHRFGYMSHHIEGECGCHPPALSSQPMSQQQLPNPLSEKDFR